MPKLQNRYRDSLVRSEYFESELHQAVCTAALKILDAKSGLSCEAVVEELYNIYLQQNREEWLKEVETECKELFGLPLLDAAYIESQVIKFAKYAAMRNAITESTELIYSPARYDEVLNKVRDALVVGVSFDDVGHKLFEDAEERFLTRKIRVDRTRFVPTGFPSIDKVLLGGISSGEQGIILAPTSRGKSSVLVNIGAAALLHRKKVLHITLEMKADKIADRYDIRLSGLSRSDLYMPDDAIEKTLRLQLGKHSRLGGEVLIRYFPAYSLTVQQLRSQIEFLEGAENFHPDLLIVDYGDKLKPTRNYSERRHELSQIFDELRALAGELDFAEWTASQSNRLSASKQIITAEDMGEDYGKSQNADIIVTLCQTEVEFVEKKMRLFLAKMRDTESRFTVNCIFDPEKMRIQEIEDQ